MKKLLALLALLTLAFSAHALTTNAVLTWAPSTSTSVVQYRVYESNAAGIKLLATVGTNNVSLTNGGYVFSGLGINITNYNWDITHLFCVTAASATIESPLTNWFFIPIASPPPDSLRIVPLGALLTPLPSIVQASPDLVKWRDVVRLEKTADGRCAVIVLAPNPDPRVELCQFSRLKSPQPPPAALMSPLRR